MPEPSGTTSGPNKFPIPTETDHVDVVRDMAALGDAIDTTMAELKTLLERNAPQHYQGASHVFALLETVDFFSIANKPFGSSKVLMLWTAKWTGVTPGSFINVYLEQGGFAVSHFQNLYFDHGPAQSIVCAFLINNTGIDEYKVKVRIDEHTATLADHTLTFLSA